MARTRESEKLTDTHKWCAKCMRMLPFDHFTRNAHKKSGLDNYCRECKREYYKAYSNKKDSKSRVIKDAVLARAGNAQCRKCGQIKPISDFVKDKRGRYGIQYTCNSCFNEYQIKLRALKEVYDAPKTTKERRKEAISIKKANAEEHTKLAEKFKETTKATRPNEKYLLLYMTRAVNSQYKAQKECGVVCSTIETAKERQSALERASGVKFHYNTIRILRMNEEKITELNEEQ